MEPVEEKERPKNLLTIRGSAIAFGGCVLVATIGGVTGSVGLAMLGSILAPLALTVLLVLWMFG